MKEIVLSKKTSNKIITLWKQSKSKADISREVGVCRKKVAKIIRLSDHKKIFDVKQQRNWLINE